MTAEQRAVRNAVITDLYAGYYAYKAAARAWISAGTVGANTSTDGFRVIDQLLSWAEANGLWVVLDMHAAPGAQGTDLNICDGFHANNLWTEAVFQDMLVSIWEAISRKYRDKSRIAMYELINEPNNVPGGGADDPQPDAAARDDAEV